MKQVNQEQLIHFLSDMYSVEQQALAQLVSAPDIAGEPTLAVHFRQHHDETLRQAELVAMRLAAHGGSPSVIKDAVKTGRGPRERAGDTRPRFVH